MSDQSKRLIKLLARILVAAGLLTWVFSQVDLAQFRQTVKAARWHYLIGVWLATAVFFWMQSVAMRLILRKQDCDVKARTLFGVSSITALYSLVLPGLLSTGVKWYILKRHTGKGSHVLSSMLYNQVALSVVMAVIGLTALIVTNPTPQLFPNARWPWLVPVVSGCLLIVLVLTTLLALNRRTARPVAGFLRTLLRPLPAAVRNKADAVLTQLAVFQTAGRRFHLTIALIDASNGLLTGILIYWFAARAASVGVSIGVLLWICAVVFLLSKVPISIANLGVREVTLVALLTGFGVVRSQALLMSMILFSSLVFMAGLGAVYQLLWWTGGAHDGAAGAAIAGPVSDPEADNAKETP